MKKDRPFLKWAGSKYRYLDKILHWFPTANRLIEPFAGSASVFMNTHYPDYLLAESNQDIVLLYSQLQQEGMSFIDYCQTFFTTKNNDKETYYRLRDHFNQCKDHQERAALFLYLNRHGYNGLCRYNQSGKYNVPFGSYKNPYFPRDEMNHFYQKSKSTAIVHSDFRETFTKAKPGDLIYCDPPYSPVEQGTNFSSYTANKFGEEEHMTLADLAEASANQGIFVMISNHDTPFTRHQYRHSQIISFSVQRWISCHGQSRLPVQELLAIFRPK